MIGSKTRLENRHEKTKQKKKQLMIMYCYQISIKTWPFIMKIWQHPVYIIGLYSSNGNKMIRAYQSALHKTIFLPLISQK